MDLKFTLDSALCGTRVAWGKGAEFALKNGRKGPLDDAPIAVKLNRRKSVTISDTVVGEEATEETTMQVDATTDDSLKDTKTVLDDEDEGVSSDEDVETNVQAGCACTLLFVFLCKGAR